MEVPEDASPSDAADAAAAQALEAARRSVAEADALLGALRAKIDEAETLKATLASLLASTQAKAAEVSDAATAALAAKAQISGEQAVIATKSSHIQAAQEHADKVRAELDRLQTAAAQSATEAEGQRSRAQSSTDAVAELLAAVRADKATADTELASTQASREAAKVAAEAAKKLADRADSIETKLANYEAKLSDLATQSDAQLKEITRLLPGATAAGLAHAFDDRRKTFLKPSVRWQWLFVASLLALIALALSGLWNVYKGTEVLGWDDLARLWMARLPIAAALIWLALHASRESALAKRLEEDYGYKAAIAASFQGFQQQMAEIGTATAQGSPLSKLCEDTLATIGSPPGRIYDKHKLTTSPASEIAAVAKDAVTPAAR